MSQRLSLWDVQDETRNLWAQVIRGLFGVIRIMEHYADGYTFGAPSNEIREAGERLIQLAARCDELKIQDPNQPKYNTK
jgi:hypothetical protein